MAPDNNPSGTPNPPTGGGSGTSAMEVDIDDITTEMCKVEEKPPTGWFERMVAAVLRAMGLRKEAERRADAERCLDEDRNRPD